MLNDLRGCDPQEIPVTFLNEKGYRHARIGSGVDQETVIIDSKTLLELVASFREKVHLLIIGGLRIAVIERAGNVTLTVESNGVGSHLRLGIPPEGSPDQVLHIGGGEIFLDRGQDAVSGSQPIQLYPLPDQTLAIPRTLDS